MDAKIPATQADSGGMSHSFSDHANIQFYSEGVELDCEFWGDEEFFDGVSFEDEELDPWDDDFLDNGDDEEDTTLI